MIAGAARRSSEKFDSLRAASHRREQQHAGHIGITVGKSGAARHTHFDVGAAPSADSGRGTNLFEVKGVRPAVGALPHALFRPAAPFHPPARRLPAAGPLFENDAQASSTSDAQFKARVALLACPSPARLRFADVATFVRMFGGARLAPARPPHLKMTAKV